ncbi:MAG: alanine:cation symporter family protein [Oscillospiraceae bacterium]|nr:alanine:cation symporter family protein [Oscillospiraceae bacterium]
MENLEAVVTKVNNAINGFVWGVPVLSLLILTGVLMTILTKVFQITHIGYWLKHTLGSIFKKEINAHVDEKGTVSQFQALCTALAATVGVGNIAGVAGAIILGGPGAVFWMWVAAFFGMMTNYSENVLGIFYRRKNSKGEWTGGAMYYLRDGLGGYRGFKHIGKVLAILFSIFAVLASFGIGNASQIGNISANLQNVFAIPGWVTGILLMILTGLVVVGGIKRIAAVTEKIVPFMVVLYIIGTVAVIIMNASRIGAAFGAIFSSIFGIKAVAGGAAGYVFAEVITMGFKRGVFSNEAGLGSSVMVHSASNVKEPVRQGMWGIFEVFMDTIIVCTLTALSILTSGCVDLTTGVADVADKNALVSEVFKNSFGSIGGYFIAIAILLFAFSTVLGWNYYGTKAWEFLFGTKSTIVYKVIFVLFIFVGATMDLALAWDISDTFNGLMALPNLIGVIALCPTVVKITKNYIRRNIKGERLEPMLSAHPEIQEKHASEL